MKKVKWKWDMGCYIAFCPYCGEPTYWEDHCEYCNKKYKWKEGRYKPREVVVGKYTVVQTTSKAIYIYDGERIVYHASSAKRMSKRQLKKMVEHYEMVISDDFLKEARVKNETE